MAERALDISLESKVLGFIDETIIDILNQIAFRNAIIFEV